jgi:hypothetical protein
MNFAFRIPVFVAVGLALGADPGAHAQPGPQCRGRNAGGLTRGERVKSPILTLLQYKREAASLKTSHCL